MITGNSVSCSRRRRSTSSPSIPGSLTSSTATSGRSAWQRARPSSPLSATSTV